MARPYRITLNTATAIAAAVHWVNTVPVKDPDTIYEMRLQPWKKPKTWRQIKTIHLWCMECATTDINEWMGHDKDWWYRYWKMKAYLPLLEHEAYENDDVQLISDIKRARGIWKKLTGEEQEDFERWLFGPDPDGQDEFSYGNASREHMTEMIDTIPRKAGEMGIVLTIPESDDK